MKFKYEIIGEKEKNKDLKLETDLFLSSEDVSFMKKSISHDRQDLEGYLDFLEEIEAFKSKETNTKYYK